MSDSKPKTWVDGPFELLSSELSSNSGTQQVAAEMTIVHNCVIRGINAIYLQATKVASAGTPDDKLDFANFALRWARMLDEHHRSEERRSSPGS
ncbi:hypothetical protein BJX66DRAFT_345355 [Aspergillus keveii]|uniref:Uncharacterized protein n=1 Tax=Aspergillus keveii TaxID=714993 RepID=A0ABR4FIC7_9EURO